MLRIGILALAIVSLSSCVWTTPSGIREMGRAMNGAVVTGKSAPNKADEYHITQRATDNNSLERLLAELGGQDES